MWIRYVAIGGQNRKHFVESEENNCQWLKI